MSKTLQAGIYAWIGSCFASLGMYLNTLQSWNEFNTLPVAAGAAGLASVGWAGLAAYFRSQGKVDDEETRKKPSEPVLDDVIDLIGD